MRLFIFLIVILVFNSCNLDKKSGKANETDASIRPELSKDSKIFLGNRLFSEKTCITCHAIDKKKVGPSIVDIVGVYNAKNANIIAFLKGKSEPIVDTTKSQVAIMQANINGFLKKITDEELDAMHTYMQHVVELKNK